MGQEKGLSATSCIGIGKRIDAFKKTKKPWQRAKGGIGKPSSCLRPKSRKEEL